VIEVADTMIKARKSSTATWTADTTSK
jgi:hypothetical protein